MSGQPLQRDPQRAWAAYEPGRERPWTLAAAAHLHRRAGFGAGWAQLQQTLAAGPQAAIDRLLHGPADAASSDAAWDGAEREAARGGGPALRAWWLRRMLESPFPLREKLTFFWRGLVALPLSAVGDAVLLAEHVQRLRSHALGSYRRLLASLLQDPAFLLGLRAAANRKAAPQPQVMRHLLGRLAVGLDQLTDRDASEAARALSGWFVIRGRLRFFERERDERPRTVFGRTGRWTPNEVLQIALDQPAARRRLARRLYRWFISEADEPDAALLEPLEETLGPELDVGAAAERILRSNLFFSPAAYRRRVKHPVEFALGLAIAFDALIPTAPLGADLAELGQDVLQPPTLDGWPGGPCWLTGAAMVQRRRLAAQLIAPAGRYQGRLHAAVSAYLSGKEPRAAAAAVFRLLLDDEAPAPRRRALLEEAASDPRKAARPERLIEAVAASPEFQLA